MSKTAYHILPVTEDILKTMGEQIKLARLRRDLPAKLVPESAALPFGMWKTAVHPFQSAFMLPFCTH